MIIFEGGYFGFIMVFSILFYMFEIFHNEKILIFNFKIFLNNMYDIRYWQSATPTEGDAGLRGNRR